MVLLAQEDKNLEENTRENDKKKIKIKKTCFESGSVEERERAF